MKNALALSAFASTIMLASVTPVTAASNPLEVRDVLELTVLAMKGDQQKTLAMLNRGNAVLRHDDLYVYCADAQGRVVAGLPSMIGRDFAELKDKTGKEFGRYVLANASEGEFGFTGYYLPKPGGSEEFYKEDYFTKIGDLTCGAGYYTTKTE